MLLFITIKLLLILKDSNQKQTCCLGSRPYSQTLNQNVFEKVHAKTQKVIKIVKGICTICGRNESQIFNK